MVNIRPHDPFSPHVAEDVETDAPPAPNPAPEVTPTPDPDEAPVSPQGGDAPSPAETDDPADMLAQLDALRAQEGTSDDTGK